MTDAIGNDYHRKHIYFTNLRFCRSQAGTKKGTGNLVNRLDTTSRAYGIEISAEKTIRPWPTT